MMAAPLQWSLEPKIEKCNSRLTDRCTKTELSKLIKLITGHGPFRYHLQKGNDPNYDSTCRFCLEEEESAIHIIKECYALTNIKPQIVTNDVGQPYLYNMEETMNCILDFSKERTISSSFYGCIYIVSPTVACINF